MTNQEIKELLQIFDESGVAEMEVQRGENRLRLRRAPTAHELTVPRRPARCARSRPRACTGPRGRSAQRIGSGPQPHADQIAHRRDLLRCPLARSRALREGRR